MSFLFCEKERLLLQSVFCEEFCFFFLSPSSLEEFRVCKNVSFFELLFFVLLIFHTRISQIAFHLFLLALKVCLQNLFCCAVVGRGEREEKTLGKKEL